VKQLLPIYRVPGDGNARLASPLLRGTAYLRAMTPRLTCHPAAATAANWIVVPVMRNAQRDFATRLCRVTAAGTAAEAFIVPAAPLMRTWTPKQTSRQAASRNGNRNACMPRQPEAEGSTALHAQGLEAGRCRNKHLQDERGVGGCVHEAPI
jgi:hypothetical protein